MNRIAAEDTNTANLTTLMTYLLASRTLRRWLSGASVVGESQGLLRLDVASDGLHEDFLGLV